MKVKEIIKFFSELKTNDENIEAICKKFELNNYLDTLCCNLSGGNKRKLHFAIALMNKPSLLLLDEPSTGMDHFSKKMMINNINSLIKVNHRYNLILSTHSVEEAGLICDRVSCFKNGNFKYIGNINEFKMQKNNEYKYIKFDQSCFNIEEIPSKEKAQESFDSISKLVSNFEAYSDYFISHTELEPQLNELYLIINKLKKMPKIYKLIKLEKIIHMNFI